MNKDKSKQLNKKELQSQINELLERQRDLKALLNAVETSLSSDPVFGEFQTLRASQSRVKGPAQSGIRIKGQLSFRGRDKVSFKFDDRHMSIIAILRVYCRLENYLTYLTKNKPTP